MGNDTAHEPWCEGDGCHGYNQGKPVAELFCRAFFARSSESPSTFATALQILVVFWTLHFCCRPNLCVILLQVIEGGADCNDFSDDVADLIEGDEAADSSLNLKPADSAATSSSEKESRDVD